MHSFLQVRERVRVELSGACLEGRWEVHRDTKMRRNRPGDSVTPADTTFPCFTCVAGKAFADPAWAGVNPSLMVWLYLRSGWGDGVAWSMELIFVYVRESNALFVVRCPLTT